MAKWAKFPLFGNLKIDLSRSEFVFGHQTIKIKHSSIVELHFILITRCLKTNSERDKSNLRFTKSGNFAHFAITTISNFQLEFIILLILPPLRGVAGQSIFYFIFWAYFLFCCYSFSHHLIIDDVLVMTLPSYTRDARLQPIG